METKKLLEGSKIIAAFEGLETFTEFNQWLKCEEVWYHDGDRAGAFTEISTHYLEWNNLMPIIQKIESMGWRVDIVDKNVCVIFGDENNDLEYNHSYCKPTKIEAVWTGVVEFIKWHNKQKENEKDSTN